MPLPSGADAFTAQDVLDALFCRRDCSPELVEAIDEVILLREEIMELMDLEPVDCHHWGYLGMHLERLDDAYALLLVAAQEHAHLRDQLSRL